MEKLLRMSDDGSFEEVLVNLPSSMETLAAAALAAFDIVYLDATEKAALADASDADKLAIGFVASSVVSGATAQIMTEGAMHHATDLGITGDATYPVEVGAPVFLSGSTAGAKTTIPVTTAGSYLQRVGTILKTDGAGKALTMDFEIATPVLRK